MLARPKIIPGTKAQTVACERCTFVNPADAKVCGMCEGAIKPLTHEVQANGMWRCGGCSNLNRKGLKECLQCRTPFYSTVTSSAPSQIFCSQCGFLNDGDNVECVHCDNQLRSKLEKISSDLRDSTNFLARDMGVNINVKCPGCLVVCVVPPATAGLRCGTCHTYFASPSVGDVTNFHMSRLASSITSSFRGLFSRDRSSVAEQEQEAPVGRLLAIGDIAQQRNSLDWNVDADTGADVRSVDASSSASFSLGDDDEEQKPDAVATNEPRATRVSAPPPPTPVAATGTPAASAPRIAEAETRQIESPRRTYGHLDAMEQALKLHAPPVAVAVEASRAPPPGVPVALHTADSFDMIKVEGDIVEL